MLTCKTCGQVFRSGIQMDPKSFETSTLSNNAESCRHCETVHSYDKGDYHFED